MQLLDGLAVVLHVIIHLLVLLQQVLHAALIVSNIIRGHETERVQHPRISIVGVSEVLVIADGLLQLLTTLLGTLLQPVPHVHDLVDAAADSVGAEVTLVDELVADLGDAEQQLGLVRRQVVLQSLRAWRGSQVRGAAGWVGGGARRQPSRGVRVGFREFRDRDSRGNYGMYKTRSDGTAGSPIQTCLMLRGRILSETANGLLPHL